MAAPRTCNRTPPHPAPPPYGGGGAAPGPAAAAAAARRRRADKKKSIVSRLQGPDRKKSHWPSCSVRQLDSAHPDMEECGVCLLEHGSDDAYVLSSCGHSLHRPCVRANVVARLTAGTDACACYTPGCGLPLLDSDVAALLGAEGADLLRRALRRRLERAEPALRFCPAAGCDAQVRGGSAAAPELVCALCGAGFCFLHATAHAPGRAACVDFSRRESSAPENLASLAEIQRGARRCPRADCGAYEERAGGCNSIVCARCGTSFCWLCGCEISAGELPVHYQVRGAALRRCAPLPGTCHSLTIVARPSLSPLFSPKWWNLKSDCRFRQFVDTPGEISPAFRMLLNLATFFYAVLFGVPAMLITAALCVALPCCCIPFFRYSSERVSTAFMTVSSILASMMLIAAACVLSSPIVMPIALVLLALRCCARQGAGASDGSGAAAAAMEAAAPPAPDAQLAAEERLTITDRPD